MEEGIGYVFAVGTVGHQDEVTRSLAGWKREVECLLGCVGAREVVVMGTFLMNTSLFSVSSKTCSKSMTGLSSRWTRSDSLSTPRGRWSTSSSRGRSGTLEISGRWSNPYYGRSHLLRQNNLCIITHSRRVGGGKVGKSFLVHTMKETKGVIVCNE